MCYDIIIGVLLRLYSVMYNVYTIVNLVNQVHRQCQAEGYHTGWRRGRPTSKTTEVVSVSGCKCVVSVS